MYIKVILDNDLTKELPLKVIPNLEDKIILSISSEDINKVVNKQDINNLRKYTAENLKENNIPYIDDLEKLLPKAYLKNLDFDKLKQENKFSYEIAKFNLIKSFIKNNPILLIYKIIADYLNFKFIKQIEDLDLLYLSINKTLASKMLKEISYEEDKGGCTSCKKNSILKKYLNIFYKQNNGLEI